MRYKVFFFVLLFFCLGNGGSGFSGDGGAATSATFGMERVFGDSSGQIYIGDSGN